MQRFELNISREPRTTDGGIIVNNYGQLLELYVEDDTEFYVKIIDNNILNNYIIHSINNKIIFDNNNINNNVIVYNISINTTLIAVFNVKKEHAIYNNFMVYN